VVDREKQMLFIHDGSKWLQFTTIAVSIILFKTIDSLLSESASSVIIYRNTKSINVPPSIRSASQNEVLQKPESEHNIQLAKLKQRIHAVIHPVSSKRL
jgi:hypothetical protein